jgi:hypothetical protein
MWGTTGIKYLFKYIYEGSERAEVQISNGGTFNEVQNFLNTRYIGPTEACYQIMNHDLYTQSHSVQFLEVHLENKQTLNFEDSITAEQVGRQTTLTEWFRLNEIFEQAQQFKYIEIPQHFFWDSQS